MPSLLFACLLMRHSFLLGGRLNSISSSGAGLSYELDAIAAVIIGGAIIIAGMQIADAIVQAGGLIHNAIV